MENRSSTLPLVLSIIAIVVAGAALFMVMNAGGGFQTALLTRPNSVSVVRDVKPVDTTGPFVVQQMQSVELSAADDSGKITVEYYPVLDNRTSSKTISFLILAGVKGDARLLDSFKKISSDYADSYDTNLDQILLQFKIDEFQRVFAEKIQASALDAGATYDKLGVQFLILNDVFPQSWDKQSQDFGGGFLLWFIERCCIQTCIEGPPPQCEWICGSGMCT